MFTAVTTWATAASAVPETEPAVAVTTASPLPTERTRPSESTDATDASLLAHVTAPSAMRSPYWSCTCAESRAVSCRAANSRELAPTVTRAGSGGSGIVSSPQDRAAARARTAPGRRHQRRDAEKTSRRGTVGATILPPFSERRPQWGERVGPHMAERSYESQNHPKRLRRKRLYIQFDKCCECRSRCAAGRTTCVWRHFLRASGKPKYGYWRAARRAHGEHCARSTPSVCT